MSNKIIQLNEGIIKEELKELVRSRDLEWASGTGDAATSNAAKYERTQERLGYRSG